MDKITPVRKKILINKRFQLKYALIIVCILLAMVALFEWDFYYTMKTILPKAFAKDIIKEDILFFHILLLVKSFIFMVLVVFISLFFSHRIAGPAYRIQKVLSTMIEEGDLTKQFQLREKDELKELADALNTMTSNLRLKLLSDEQFREKTRTQMTEMMQILKAKETLTTEDKKKLISKAESLTTDSLFSPVSFKI